MMTQLIVSTLLFCLLSAALPCSCDKIEDALQSRVTSSVAEPGDDSSENISTEGYEESVSATTVLKGATLPVHSTMGLTAFTMPSGSFSYASFAGYGAIPHSMGENQYKYLQWKSPANRVVRTMVDGPNGSFLGSTAITNSGGHSGGPLYFYNATMENGQPVYHCQLIGITSGKRTLDTQTEPTLISYYVCASFFQLNSFFVNFAKEVAL